MLLIIPNALTAADHHHHRGHPYWRRPGFPRIVHLIRCILHGPRQKYLDSRRLRATYPGFQPAPNHRRRSYYDSRRPRLHDSR